MSSNGNKCKVFQCRFSSSHTTPAHICGGCGEKGHGLVECGDDNAKNALQKFMNDKIHCLGRCNVDGCLTSETHCREAHHCEKCSNRHPETECIIQSVEEYKQRFTGDSIFDSFNVQLFLDNHRNSSVFVPITMGMGCSMYIRLLDNKVSALFMHSDSWGQYTGVSDLPIYNKFIEGCHILPTNSFTIEEPVASKTIKCPFCKTENTMEEIMSVKGSEEECKICFKEKVDQFFSKCGHAQVCSICITQL